MSNAELRNKRKLHKQSNFRTNSALKTRGKITPKMFNVDAADDFESGPTFFKSRTKLPAYLRNWRLVDSNWVNHQMLACEGKDWGAVQSELLNKCKGAAQASAMRAQLNRLKTMWNDLYFELHKDAAGKAYTKNASSDKYTWYIDQYNIVRVVPNRKQFHIDAAFVQKKLTVISDPDNPLIYYVQDQGLWYLCEAHALHTFEESKSDVLFNDHACTFYEKQLRKWVSLVSKKSANSKEIERILQLQKNIADCQLNIEKTT